MGAAAPMSQLAAAPNPTSPFDDVLAGSCEQAECYLFCKSEGYWAGYCSNGTCICLWHP